MKNICTIFVLAIIIISCDNKRRKEQAVQGTFGYDVAFLKQYTDPIILKSDDAQKQLLIVSDYQGRVMTSTLNGMQGNSYGWINYDLIKSQQKQKQINLYGGEDRFWIGPEGGQYSIFFKPGTSFDYPNWQVPAALDTEPFILLSQSKNEVTFSKTTQLQNHSGTIFNVAITRIIRLIDNKKIEDLLGIPINDEVDAVAFESVNTLKNVGNRNWKKDEGLLSIWILGMMNANDQTTIVVPFKPVPKPRETIRTGYFNKLGGERLHIADSVLFYKGDGKYRSKIGLPPKMIKPVFGSYDAGKNILTVVQIDFNHDTNYVNSLWKYHEKPYNGDVINVYNDGALSDTARQPGSFYELESSSPAKELKSNENIRHTHRTFHFEGDEEYLNRIMKDLFGVKIAQTQQAF
jgi:hypothetical protein